MKDLSTSDDFCRKVDGMSLSSEVANTAESAPEPGRHSAGSNEKKCGRLRTGQVQCDTP